MIAKYRGFSSLNAGGQTTTTDYALTDTMLMRGARILAKGHVWGDKLDLYLVDKDGVTGLPPGTVLAQMAKDFQLDSDKQFQIDMMVPDANPFPAAGLYLRSVYNSAGLLVAVDLKLFVYSYVPMPPPPPPPFNGG